MPQARGDEHYFLGMNIKFKDKKVKIRMKKLIQKAADTFMDDITRNATSPATSYLFKISEAAKLSEENSDNFHSVVASLFIYFKDMQVRNINVSGFPINKSCGTRQR